MVNTRTTRKAQCFSLLLEDMPDPADRLKRYRAFTPQLQDMPEEIQRIQMIQAFYFAEGILLILEQQQLNTPTNRGELNSEHNTSQADHL